MNVCILYILIYGGRATGGNAILSPRRVHEGGYGLVTGNGNKKPFARRRRKQTNKQTNVLIKRLLTAQNKHKTNLRSRPVGKRLG